MAETTDLDNVIFLAYVDEEYEFKGMRKFVEAYKDKVKPNFILSIDGGDEKIGYACRGCVEIDFIVIGKSGHSANPQNGVNAIRTVNSAVDQLEQAFKKQRN